MSTGAPVVVAQGVGIRFVVALSRPRTIPRTIADRLLGRVAEQHKFWALRDISFQIHAGDVLGVIGPNGAGKSTLLLTLAGVFLPDEGHLEAHGRRTLLTLGPGFDADLTGRENIYLSAAFLGLSKRTIETRIGQIIEFAGVGEFIDAPLHTYSSGMRARLGFSVAAHADPDILLLDEILGVGDAAFRAKSRAKMRELISRSRAIVIVTHNLAFVRQFCTKALWLSGGQLAAFGDSASVARGYMEQVKAATPDSASSDHVTDV